MVFQALQAAGFLCLCTAFLNSFAMQRPCLAQALRIDRLCLDLTRQPQFADSEGDEAQRGPRGPPCPPAAPRASGPGPLGIPASPGPFACFARPDHSKHLRTRPYVGSFLLEPVNFCPTSLASRPRPRLPGSCPASLTT